jgi:hypothetical protein
VCGNGTVSPLVKQARFISNKLAGNDVAILLANYDPTCTKSVATATGDVACRNVIQDSNGYPHGKASADANTTGFVISPAVGYQAGVSGADNHNVICDNAVFGAGYAPLGARSSLPDPLPPAFVRPVDIVSGGGTGPAIDPVVYGTPSTGSLPPGVTNHVTAQQAGGPRDPGAGTCGRPASSVPAESTSGRTVLAAAVSPSPDATP